MRERSILLPEGLRDLLPPEAEAEARLLGGLLNILGSDGYERVSPPLAEFDESLDAIVGEGRVPPRFRFMDPSSGRMLALRTDITGQVARIAATRLGHWARPLRLAYAGPVLRVKGSQLRADRQFLQVGAELVGNDSPQAVAEVASLALRALESVGVTGLSLDFTMPDFLSQLLVQQAIPDDVAETLRDAIDAKDIAALTALAPAPIFTQLIAAVGPAPMALAHLESLGAKDILAARIATMGETIALLAKALPAVCLTLDPAEQRGFEYQTAIGFSIFAAGLRGEIGRGGTYVIHRPDGSNEAAVGFSLYVDALVEAGVGLEPHPRIFLPLGTRDEDVAQLRTQGWVIVQSLNATDDENTARAQRCRAIWDGKVVELV